MLFYNNLISLGLLIWSATIPSSLAQQILPYNPTRIFTAQGGSVAYIFSPSSSNANQFSLSSVNTSSQIGSSTNTTVLYSTLPFLSSVKSRAFTPVVDDAGFTVVVGDCSSVSDKVELWQYQFNSANPSWSQLQVTSSDTTLSANFLAAGFIYNSTSSSNGVSMFTFGGMCPYTSALTTASWQSQATYFSTMLDFSPSSTSNSQYKLSSTSGSSSPIAEAGLTITALTSSSQNSAASQQQNFILLGGHTQTAFINMSQAAIFSLPAQTWSFVNIQNPSGSGNSVSTLEPRSGHTAVLSADGGTIVVLGGWVGDISTPAVPQLVVLQVGSGYAGGTGSWAWTVPAQGGPVANGQGLFGHGATLLPGGVMMVVGGYKMSSSGSKVKRDTASPLFFNLTSLTWTSSYINPSSTLSPAYHSISTHSGLTPSQKAGLGVGLTFGLLAVIGIAVFWVLYRRKLREKRIEREKELRAQALGTERYNTPSLLGDDYRYHGRRSSSWGTPPKAPVATANNAFPWAPIVSMGEAGRIGLEKEDHDGPENHQDEKFAVPYEVPPPAKNLRRSLNSRNHSAYDPVTGNGSVFRIDEEDETSLSGSVRRARTPPPISGRDSTLSDPFKDPPTLLPTVVDVKAEERRKEVAGWVEDWTSAAESMNMSRNPSQAQSRTYSNLSQAHSHSHSSGTQSGRGSPDKSDRTGSNLSERSIGSTASFNRSLNPMSRNTSQRSASAGYLLFANASAAMGKLAGARLGSTNQNEVPQNLARSPSVRSVSLNIDTTSDRTTQQRERGNTFSSGRPSLGHLVTNDESNHEKDYWTPPESPIKEKYQRTSSLTNTGRKALGLLGSVRRVFTGTGGVDVQDRVATLEARSGSSSPTKHVVVPEMSERAAPRRTSSAGAAFLRGQKGARAWDADTTGISHSVGVPSNTLGAIRRKRPSDQFPDQLEDCPATIPNLRGQATQFSASNHLSVTDDEDDWDIETAVQKRVVQVMFTVPKEKLRVVNADALSLLSSNRSEIDGEEEMDRERTSLQVKRMSSVRELVEEGTEGELDGYRVESGGEEGVVDGKGKGKEIGRSMGSR